MNRAFCKETIKNLLRYRHGNQAADFHNISFLFSLNHNSIKIRTRQPDFYFVALQFDWFFFLHRLLLLINTDCDTTCLEEIMRTIRLLYPDWMSGGLPEYDFGGSLLEWIVPPDPAQPVVSVSVADLNRQSLPLQKESAAGMRFWRLSGMRHKKFSNRIPTASSHLAEPAWFRSLRLTICTADIPMPASSGSMPTPMSLFLKTAIRMRMPWFWALCSGRENPPFAL